MATVNFRICRALSLLFLWREKCVHLHLVSANQNEYLVVKFINGKVEHIQGPIAMFRNPLEHSEIKTLRCISLDANEVLVIYSQDPDTQAVTRFLQHGPTVFMPKANQWLHEFKWHGTDPENKVKQIPGSLIFTKLQIIPDQFYYNVPEVRTADDALIRVKLMLFYELKNIELMLNATQDPMADFINCLEADVVAFASKLTYMEFIDQSSELNDTRHYPQLMERCATIGYEVSKVVFRGYFASPVLQSMHDNTIMSRNKLKMAYETAEQEQEITDVNLKNELERIQLEQEMELASLRHKHSIERTEQEHKLQLQKEQAEEKVKAYVVEQQHNLMRDKAKAQQKIEHYKNLHNLDVDMNDYVLSENPQPDKVTRIIDDGTSATIHLHQQERGAGDR